MKVLEHLNWKRTFYGKIIEIPNFVYEPTYRHNQINPIRFIEKDESYVMTRRHGLRSDRLGKFGEFDPLTNLTKLPLRIIRPTDWTHEDSK